jgi:hypothetical protein
MSFSDNWVGDVAMIVRPMQQVKINRYYHLTCRFHCTTFVVWIWGDPFTRGTTMVDFDKGRDLKMWIMEHTGGPAAGGLTVRDVFACTAMGATLEAMGDIIVTADLAQRAYEIADAMLEARITLPPKQEPTVEEAFGL